MSEHMLYCMFALMDENADNELSLNEFCNFYDAVIGTFEVQKMPLLHLYAIAAYWEREVEKARSTHSKWRKDTLPLLKAGFEIASRNVKEAEADLDDPGHGSLSQAQLDNTLKLLICIHITLFCIWPSTEPGSVVRGVVDDVMSYMTLIYLIGTAFRMSNAGGLSGYLHDPRPEVQYANRRGLMINVVSIIAMILYKLEVGGHDEIQVWRGLMSLCILRALFMDRTSCHIIFIIKNGLVQVRARTPALASMSRWVAVTCLAPRRAPCCTSG